MSNITAKQRFNALTNAAHAYSITAAALEGEIVPFEIIELVKGEADAKVIILRDGAAEPEALFTDSKIAISAFEAGAALAKEIKGQKFALDVEENPKTKKTLYKLNAL